MLYRGVGRGLEFLIDCEEDRTLRLVGMLREVGCQDLQSEAFGCCAESPGRPRSLDEFHPRRAATLAASVVLWGVLFASGLVVVALWLVAVWIVPAKDGRLTATFFALGALLTSIGITAVAGTCLWYQARPSPRPPVGSALVWRPTATVRAVNSTRSA